MGDYTLNISPFDSYGTAYAMHQAVSMLPTDRKARAEALRRIVQEADVRQWFYQQVQSASVSPPIQAKMD
jgi:trehalose-6-phosphate synthase